MRSFQPLLVASLGIALLGTGFDSGLRAVELPFSPTTIDFSLGGGHDIAMGDVDADGDVDLLAVGNFSDQVRYYENLNGDGSVWVIEVIDGTFDDARGAALGDIDGDGDLDAIGAAYGDDAIVWWENTDAAWNEFTVDPAFNGARAVAAADIDGDGDLDLAAAGQLEDEIAWWENNDGDGTSWQKRVVDAGFDGAHDVKIDDVDGDGDLDLIGAAIEDNAVLWWENVGGRGLSWTPHLVDADLDGARGVAAADVDGDGDRDLLAAARDDDDLRWYENLDGDGEFWTTRTIDSFFDGAIDLVAEDLDLDGDVDVVASAVLADEVTWWENTQGDGTAWIERKIDIDVDAPFGLAVGDIDSDGDLDLGAALFNDGDLVLWSNETIHRSAVYPVETTIASPADGAVSVIAADLDGDGDEDLATAAFVGDEIRWWENLDGQGSTWIVRTVSTLGGKLDVAAADVDGDGDIDLGSTALISDEVTWYENANGDGLVWIEHELTTTYAGAHAIEFADLDGDGDIDVVASAEFEDRVAWWDNLTGDGTSWTMRTVSSDLEAARGIEVADINGDGSLDIAVAAYQEDSPIWLENTNGDGLTWIRRAFDSDFSGPDDVAMADLDGDGDLDFLLAGELEDSVSWWENLDGQGTLWSTANEIKKFLDGATGVTAVDLDGDGDLDVAAAAELSSLRWWENDGAGGTWTERSLKTGLSGTQDVISSDIDGDGRVDLVSVASLSDELFWFENLGGQALLEMSEETPSPVNQGSQFEIFSVELFHQGRLGDSDMELAGLTLLFEESDGDPLTTSEGNAVVESLDIYLDDGSGKFDPADTFVGGVSSLDLSTGLQTVDLLDDQEDLRVPFGSSKLHWVALTLTDDAAQQPLSDFQITLLNGVSGVEDAAADIPLAIEFEADATTAIAPLGPQKLTASGSCPGPVTIAVEGAEPGGNVTVIFSQNLGVFVLPFGNCSGTEFGLHDPTLLFTLVADGDGNAQTTGNAPESACGEWLQAMDVSNCGPTNIVTVPN